MSDGYDTLPAAMRTDTFNGSLLTQLSFVLISLSILVLVPAGLFRAATACGDTPVQVARLVQRFLIVATAWLTIVLGLAVSGALADWQRTPPALMLVAVGVVLLGVRLARSAAGARLAAGLPLALLVGFQGFRLPLELAMHRAYTEGLMPVQMSYSGRNLDIVTGITAIGLGVALAVARVPRWVVGAWNVMGLALLVNIVGVALLSTPRFQYFGPDHVNTFVTRLPYVTLPAVMVLAAWAGHLVILRALSRPPTGR